MDVNAITQLISTIGFPIAVCLICFWYINKKDSEHREAENNMTQAVNNNTVVIQKLIDSLNTGD